MPIYEYVCEDCHKPFEKIVLKQAEPVTCPACGSSHHTLQFSIVSKPAKSGNGDASSSSCACTPATCGCN
jgi:putative FmdB family regulatory protein